MSSSNQIIKGKIKLKFLFTYLIVQINLDGVLPVTKYKSKLTGLTVVFAQAESPIVNGYFCLPTEAYDDDGLPHTLEHLIFLGR